MKSKSVQSRLHSLAQESTLSRAAKERIKSNLDAEIEQLSQASPTRRQRFLRRPLVAAAAVAIPMTLVVGGIWYANGVQTQGGGRTVISGVGNAVMNNTTANKDNSTKVVAPPSSTKNLLTVNVSQMTVYAGNLSKLVPASATSSLKLPGTSATQASVLASDGSKGTLAAVNVMGGGVAKKAPQLYLLSPRTHQWHAVSKLTPGSLKATLVISAAALSQQWIVWTEYVPNASMANIGIQNRATGKLWHVVSGQGMQKFMRKGLEPELFMRGNSVFVYSSNQVYQYNLQTQKWSTFYTAPSGMTFLGFTLTAKGAVVQLTASSRPGASTVEQLDTAGKVVGHSYRVPKGALYITGASGNQVILDGDNATYAWTPGSKSIDLISNSSAWLSGPGGRFVAGWGYTKTAGQLLDLQAKRHYAFDANSAVVGPTSLFWTKGNTVYWTPLPK